MSEEPIRIFIGTDDTQELGAKIFEYSVRRHTDAPVVFDRMENVTWPYPKDGKNYPGTNFSFHRFAIPGLVGYKGRALYVDADMLVLRDIRELWNTPFNGAAVLCAASSDPGERRRQLSVMLMDCDKLTWDVDKIITEGLDGGKFSYDELIYGLCIEPGDRVKDALPPQWNSLEKYEPGKTGLIHYTEMEKQPWLSRRNKNGWLWLEYLRDAIKEGVVTKDEIKAAADKGWARPSLLPLLETPRVFWKPFEKIVAKRMDKGFVPHQDIRHRQKQARTGDGQAVAATGAVLACGNQSGTAG